VDLVFRCVILFPVVVLLTRVVTRRELGSLEPFDLVLLVVLGDLLQQGITQSDYSVTGSAIVIITIGLLTVATAQLNFHVRRVRVFIEGEPVILIADGTIVEKNLRRERITQEELAAQARLNEIPHLSGVQWAVLETNGRISFLQSSH
jgi:uncharacterized membrane protein YcaP (DUF421 family)